MTATKLRAVKGPPNSENSTSSEVEPRRKGGGTLIESPAVFSDDGKYLYVNSGWGARIFSIKTGECVRVLESHSEGSLVSVFSFSGHPYGLTSSLQLIKWDQKSSKVLSNISLQSEGNNESCVGGYLCSLDAHSPEKSLCCLLQGEKEGIAVLRFHSISSGKIVAIAPNGMVVKNGKHTVSFGGPVENTIMACITPKRLKVLSLLGKKKSAKLHLGSDKEWTCVQCHPTEETVAAGDSLGRVLLFRDPFSNETCRTVFHWHTLPARVIVFTPAGSSMYTGGEEHTLVKWNTDNPNVKSFRPRLPASIVHISISSDNSLLAVSTADNGIIIVDNTNRLKCVLQQLAWGVVNGSQSSLFPAGLEYDPRTRAIVLNSRPGHLQFFHPDTETFLFGMDVTQLNYLTQERDKVIVNTEVTKVCISADAAWLATIETRNEPSCSLELKLKFWMYDVSHQKFSLNTVINLPHSGLVDTIRFAPVLPELFVSETPGMDYLAVTTGRDGKFKFWAPYEYETIQSKGISWACQAVKSYKKKSCSCATFSQDGSVLAVAFEKSLTIWFVTSVSHRATLSGFNGVLNQVEFGRDSCAHLVAACSENELLVWNLVTLSLLWSVQVPVSILLADPASHFMALFTKNNNVFVFSPMNSNPVFTKNNVCSRDKHLVAARFIPRENPQSTGEHTWLHKSVLYYLESDQVLKCLDCEYDSKQSIDVAEDEEKGSAFANLVAGHITSNVSSKKPDIISSSLLNRKESIHKVLMAPSHTLPPMSLLCSNILTSFALHKSDKKKSTKDNDTSDEEDERMEADSEEDEGIETAPPKGATVIKGDLGFPFELPDFESMDINTSQAEDEESTNDLFVLDFTPDSIEN